MGKTLAVIVMLLFAASALAAAPCITPKALDGKNL